MMMAASLEWIILSSLFIGLTRYRSFNPRKRRIWNIRHEILDKFAEKLNNDAEQVWIGVCGVPGAGKTTFANELADALNNSAYYHRTGVVPMDGYHFPRQILDTFPDPDLAHKRRGAPFTFDAKRFADDLHEGRMALKQGHAAYASCLE